MLFYVHITLYSHLLPTYSYNSYNHEWPFISTYLSASILSHNVPWLFSTHHPHQKPCPLNSHCLSHPRTHCHPRPCTSHHSMPLSYQHHNPFFHYCNPSTYCNLDPHCAHPPTNSSILLEALISSSHMTFTVFSLLSSFFLVNQVLTPNEPALLIFIIIIHGTSLWELPAATPYNCHTQQFLSINNLRFSLPLEIPSLHGPQLFIASNVPGISLWPLPYVNSLRQLIVSIPCIKYPLLLIFAQKYCT